MVDGDLFDKLARIGSMIRKRPEPFGAIQVVVTGDFFQLPPVMKGSGNVKFAFEAEMWAQTIKKTFNLTKVFRQRDPEFVDMLNEMRFGRLTTKSIMRFKALAREIVYEDGLGGTELFPRREDVERSNTMRMTRITGKEQVYNAYDGGAITDAQQREKMLANFMPPKRLVLKEGAQVCHRSLNPLAGRPCRVLKAPRRTGDADQEYGRDACERHDGQDPRLCRSRCATGLCGAGRQAAIRLR
ncbi:hypothetical protein C2E23DRAFT_385765 [Lenzites betulinus]|nr:hypothetical protein C2E23DRAFT_385765 [Lenzites betulinus]